MVKDYIKYALILQSIKETSGLFNVDFQTRHDRKIFSGCPGRAKHKDHKFRAIIKRKRG